MALSFPDAEGLAFSSAFTAQAGSMKATASTAQNIERRARLKKEAFLTFISFSWISWGAQGHFPLNFFSFTENR
jgi:hypothetical protein